MKKRRLFVVLPTLGACLLALGVFVFLCQNGGDSDHVLAGAGKGKINILFAGVDDAGQNTDMMLLCSLDKREGSVRVLQIPRDTFFRTSAGTGKINRLYRVCYSKYGGKRAAEELCNILSDSLNLQIDAYLVFTSETVREFVDLLDGVAVDVPFSISYHDDAGNEKTINAGERRLNGEEAVAFVRHRSSYAEGDLGRLDAQMRFLCGVYRELPRLKKIDRALAIYQKILPNLLTNLREKDIIEIMMAFPKLGAPSMIRLLRLPGEAVYTNGAWYYVLKRAATEKMLANEFGVDAPFDADGIFTDPRYEALKNVYTAPDTAYRAEAFDDVMRKRILHK